MNGEKKKRIYLMRPFIGSEELEAVKEVFESKYLTEGSVTQEFESIFAKYVGAKHGIAVTSCTTALELSLRVLGVGPGDEVIVPDFTHPATANVVSQVGAKPILVDVDVESRNVSAETLKNAVTERTRCLIPVSLFGNPLDPSVYEVGEEYNIYLVEDAACSAGAEIDGKRVGTFADVTCFSFHPRKVITTGEGGMMTTESDEIADKARSYKKFGVKNGRFILRGTNYKLSDILSAIGLQQLKKVDSIIEDRIKKAKVYNSLLADVDQVTTPEVKKNVRHTFQSYTIYVKGKEVRDKLRRDLMREGIETQIGTYALHLEPSYANVTRCGSLENSEKLFRSLLTLPLHHELTLEDQMFICNAILRHLKEYA